MDVVTHKEKLASTRWEKLNGDKTTILSLCEKYAQYTLPYMFPVDNTDEQTELQLATDSIGSQGVNHLANKIVNTLFPARSLFFRLMLDQEAKDLIEAAIQMGGNATSGPDLRSKLQEAIADVEAQLLKAEKRAEDHLNFVQYRPQAINAAKLLIITGNAMVFHPEDKTPVQVYSLRNYHVVRDCSGEMVEFMTRERKAFETFGPEVRTKLLADAAWKAAHADKVKPANQKGYSPDTEVTIYTHGCLHDDGKWHVYQWADDVRLDTYRTYTKNRLRWIPLTWNLVQGENYGRGLVADFAGAFAAINTLSNALLNIAAVMGDIKIFVDPQSMIDIERLQNSESGTYHMGKGEHVGTAQFQKYNDAQFIQSMIQRYERQIATAFLLTAAVQRDAERVTAEEIRRDQDELESSNSGVYARLAATWQQQAATLALIDTGFTSVGDGIEPEVITGMDSLSRAGEAYNLRLFMSDLALLNGVPEDVRAGIKKPQYIRQVASYHQVPYENWIATEEEIRAAQNQEAANQMALQQQAQEAQAGQAAAEAAAQAE